MKTFPTMTRRAWPQQWTGSNVASPRTSGVTQHNTAIEERSGTKGDVAAQCEQGDPWGTGK